MSRSFAPVLRRISFLVVLLLPLPIVWMSSDVAWSHRWLILSMAWLGGLLLWRAAWPAPLRRYGLLWLFPVVFLQGFGFWVLKEAVPYTSLVETEIASVNDGFSGWLHSRFGLWALGIAALLTVVYHLSRWLAPRSDALLFVCAGLLISLGLVLLYRLGPAEAELRGRAGLRMLASRQLLWCGVGLVAYLAMLRLVSREVLLHASRWKYVYIWLAVALVILTAFFGREINGRRLWLGFGPITLQSIEFVKLLILFFIASYFSEQHHPHVRHLGPFHVPRGRMMGPYVLVWGMALAPVFLQGDLGPTFLLFSVFLAMFYVGSTTRAPLITGVVLACGLGITCYILGKPTIVRTRVDMWLHPFSYSESMTQAIWAFSAGGWIGTGLGYGMPEQIPVVHSDFSIAAIGEEFGLIGLLSILAAYVAFFARAYHVANQCKDRFHSMLATGILVLLGMQTLIILAGATQLLPLTGITLPFVSYGGSSMLVNLTMLGLLTKLSEFSGQRL